MGSAEPAPEPLDTSLPALEEALLEQLHAALDDLSRAVAGLRLDELISELAPDTNSLAVLVAHTIETGRSIAHDLANDPIPRDREAAFRTRITAPEDLPRMIDQWSSELDALVRRAMSVPLDRQMTRYRQASRAWWLLQLVAHTREHAAHASLTRQLLADRRDRWPA